MLCVTQWSAALFIPTPAIAATSISQAKKTKSSSVKPVEIPPAPNAPAVLGAKVVSPQYACKRKLFYQGKQLPCDSFIRQDAEGLRDIVKNVPESVRYLDLYQKNRKTLRWMPYVGTTCALVVVAGLIAGSILKGQPTGSDADLASVPVRNALVLSGLGGLAVTFTYGTVKLAVNERNLKKSIKAFNDANPQDPVEIQVEAKVMF